MKRPAFQFYPADWRNDAGLKLCSLSARGLWIEMICIMHAAEPYGHLCAAGRPLDAKDLSKLVGESEKDVKRWLEELMRNNVCSIEEGAIISRRMVRDESVRERRASGGEAGSEYGHLGAEHGKKGGRPRKETGVKKPPLNPPPSSSSSSSDKEEPNGSLSPDESDDDADQKLNLPNCPHGDILAAYAELLPELPQPRPELWDGERAKALRARWRWCLTAKNADGKRYATCREEGLDWFRRYFRYVRRCPHLMGDNDRGWTPDLEWLVTAKNFTKVMQGNYDRKEGSA